MAQRHSRIGPAVIVIGLVAVFQMVAVTLAGLPDNGVSTSLRPATSYLSPFFTQNWRLFAPNPISADRTFWVQGAYRGDDGRTQTTEWFDWSDVELDLIRHHIVGGRGGYITNKLIGPLNSAVRDLTGQQRASTTGADPASPTGLTALRSGLETGGDNPGEIDHYMRYERSAVQLTTAILTALHPAIEFTAVRYRIGNRPVIPYEERKLDEGQRDGVRPKATFRVGGWRSPLPASVREQAVFDDFLRRHR